MTRMELFEQLAADENAGPMAGEIMPRNMIRMFAGQRHDATVLEVVARAYDREDSAQRGEPDPWTIASQDPGLERQWREERLACALAALDALAGYWAGLTASTPAEGRVAS